MAVDAKIRRYYLVLEKIKNKQFPTFKEIQEYIHDEGFEISHRTLQRDVEEIRRCFGVEVVYDSKRGGYYIDEESSLDIDSFLHFLEFITVAETFNSSLVNSEGTLRCVSFDSEGTLKGVHQLDALLRATKERKYIKFDHENYETGKITPYKIEPYLLKEYQNRWYIIGLVPEKNAVYTFGIDRITKLQVMKSKFKEENAVKPRRLFENVIGLTYQKKKVDTVLISVTPLQAKYLQSLPLHDSQEIILENKKEVQFQYKLILNYELKQQILFMGDQVKVLQPKDLIKDMKATIKKMGLKYK